MNSFEFKRCKFIYEFISEFIYAFIYEIIYKLTYSEFIYKLIIII